MTEIGSTASDERQAHWRPGPLGGLVGHSKDGELSLCRDLSLAFRQACQARRSTGWPPAPGFRWLFHAAR